METVKTYRAASEISLTVSMGKGKAKHIRFDVISNGGSEYKTGNKSLQMALENHSRYGDLFKCVAEVNADTQKKNASNAIEETKITVSSIAEAKDYLVEKMGIERTKLKNKEAICRAAKKNGIVFVGI